MPEDSSMVYYLGWLRAGLMILALALVCVGCATGPRLVKVSGTVTCKEKPVPKVVVNFVPENGRMSWGLTDSEGKFWLHYDRERAGAVTGKHQVWVAFRPTSPKEEEAFRSGAWLPHPDMANILEKYGNKEAPEITVDIKDDNQIVNLALD